MNIGRGRRVDRIVLVMVALVGIGATLWLWPRPDATVQVGPTLPTVSAPSTATSTTRSAPATTTASAAMAATTTAPTTTASITSSSTSAHRVGPAPTVGSGRATAKTVPRRTPVGAVPPSVSAAPSRPFGVDPSGVLPPNEQAGATVVTIAAAAQQSAAVPAVITVPFASSNHPDGVRISVLPHGITGNGEMWIPGPEEGIADWVDAVSWLNTPGYASPFSNHGAVILAGHINWKGVPGALSDLSEYGANDLGKIITVTMTDGRHRSYRIVRGLTVDKAQLAAESNQGPLHTAMFGQTGLYGPPDRPTEELRLISCGGQFDPAAGSYNSNIVVIARPIS
ncbi:MAG: class F sortase [Actinomycetota bacterium]|nr:class F sortase [Actinomycetota bacterium]